MNFLKSCVRHKDLLHLLTNAALMEEARERMMTEDENERITRARNADVAISKVLS